MSIIAFVLFTRHEPGFIFHSGNLLDNIFDGISELQSFGYVFLSDFPEEALFSLTASRAIKLDIVPSSRPG
jgi:hypothetical protein